ncbi:MAG: glycoside hydrolase, partial [Bacteroidaceae bacterium]
MRKTIFLVLAMALSAVPSAAQWNNSRWITVGEGNADAPNTWARFRRDVQLASLPERVEASICVDSKYWLYVNGEVAVFEGGLKRGPNPRDSYYDRVDLRPYLRKGINHVELLVWHFGKSGFSHLDSGRMGLLFSAPAI